ncbi:hypothetical protein C8Q76DRAFT_771909 [Earliella scabrosa]|nr:hypothetical protein C8Q76DRAFT_771909 [Earliella scabrosa]
MHATLHLILFLFAHVAHVLATPVIYDGRAPLSLTNANLDASAGPFLTVVKGSEDASHYSRLLGRSVPPTPLWNRGIFFSAPREQVLAVSIDNSSVFAPGGNPQFGFRRTDIIAAVDGEHTELIQRMEQSTTVFHFSIQKDELRPLNYNHEYQIVFIEPNDGSHVFGIQLGSPFTNPTGTLPAPNAHSFKVLDHALNVLFSIPFTSRVWHNFAIEVDWTARTLAVLYSQGPGLLQRVTRTAENPTVPAGADGQGDFHFGVLKLPLVDSADTPEDQGDVVHHGIQEGTTEGLLYSGVFVESAAGGISRGFDIIH